MEILGKGMHIKKGTEVIGFWGAMHPYDDGVVVDVDPEYITVDWGHKDRCCSTDSLGRTQR